MRSNRFIVVRQATARESAGRIAHSDTVFKIIYPSRIVFQRLICFLVRIHHSHSGVLSQDLKSDMEYISSQMKSVHTGGTGHTVPLMRLRTFTSYRYIPVRTLPKYVPVTRLCLGG